MPRRTARNTGGGATGAGRRPSRFAGWRGRRPFWGGLILLLGGAETLLTLRASMSVVLKAGALGVAAYLLPALMVLCGLLALCNPAQRLFYAVLGLLASLGSWITSNLGGFVVGMLLGVLGSCLAFGWLPDQGPRGRRVRPAIRRRVAGPATDSVRTVGPDGDPL